ncbi:hypothetical protein [Rubrolithibacter danxiaensis]|uniref:hypothetical protein n=1 Tax=Rubrolithibacter danxiaensis TaxID=3390805 RepID=UPI003BF8CEA2
MKKLIGIAICAAVIGLSETSYAQNKKDTSSKDTSSVGQDIRRSADTVGNKTAEAAANAAAKVADKTFKDKVGPQGQTVYIDKHSKYYYINNKGHKVYATKAELRDNPDQ